VNVRQISWELNIPGDSSWVARLVTLFGNVLCRSTVAAVASLLRLWAIVAWKVESAWECGKR